MWPLHSRSAGCAGTPVDHTPEVGSSQDGWQPCSVRGPHNVIVPDGETSFEPVRYGEQYATTMSFPGGEQSLCVSASYAGRGFDGLRRPGVECLLRDAAR